MSLHPLQLPTGQGHLKIKSVLAWQPFLAEQSPSYHEVVRWLTPSHGRAWVAGDHPLPVFWGLEVALGQENAVPSGGWRHGVPLSVYWRSHGASWRSGVGPDLSRVDLGYSCVTDRKTGRWQTRFGHLFPRMCLCVSLFCWNLELCLCGKSFSPNKESQLEGTCSSPSTCVRKPSPSIGCRHTLGSRSKAWF